MSNRGSRSYLLGLDLGTDSIGWAILDFDGKHPTGVRRLGVRRFEAGVLGNIEAGRDEAPGTARRTARQQRRQLWRRAWRMKAVFRVLIGAGLLPKSESDPDARDKTIKALDEQLAADFLPAAGANNRSLWHLLPYVLRAQAVERELPRFALGRAIYHLAARRGYQSNLKARKDEKEEGVVRSGISKLSQEMDGRTLGQYFSSLDPEESRIRNQYTSRKMYLDEFEQIWTAQAKFQPQFFTDDLKQQLHEAIFFQRALKSQRGLVGMCDREPTQRRAPLACLPAQRIRLLQRVNDLELLLHDGEIRALTANERAKLIDELSIDGDLTWAAIRKLLGLKTPRGEFPGDRFNFEEGGDKGVVGNRTAAKLKKTLADAWTELPPEKQSALVDEILNFTNEEALARRLQKAWQLTTEQAKAVAGLSFEDKYASLSKKAIQKLLPLLETGKRMQTAMKEAYGVTLDLPTLPLLPPVQPSRSAQEKNSHPAFTQLRNPTVARALSELRKVVNAIIRAYGKPAQIRLELARDLKKSRKDRQEIQSMIKANEKSRDGAKQQILREFSEKFCTPHNILKLRLAEECHWLCPYTGKPIDMQSLIGDHPQFDVEHIYPFSWSLDNSFSNKTLCHVDYNRHTKKNLTPFKAAGGSPGWQEIVNRVRRFSGSAARTKLNRFLNEEVEPDFCQRQLTETRYISRLAAQYLELLYGGRANLEHEQKVFVRTGGSTSYLRAELKLNTLLGDPDANEKTREDHRHHAIDALVVALTDQSTIQQLAASAQQASQIGRRLFTPIELPWSSLLDDVKTHLDQINVSSRVNRKLAGQLHDATVFSKPHPFVDAKGKPAEAHHVRKPLAAMSPQEVERIVDDRVRQLVKEKLNLIGQEPAKAFQGDQNLPYFTTKDGRTVLIKRARIRKSDSVIKVGSGTAARYVAPGANNHMEIVAVLNADGSAKKWEGVIVSRFDAHRRKAAKQ
ncbi:MAG TPA: type II CRISPR RNA-guided endonuclease Cas9, partial [Pirellulales bacterium]